MQVRTWKCKILIQALPTREIYHKLISKVYPRAQKSQTTLEARPLEPRIRVNPRLLELQTAKEILAEIFHARPGEVEEMIQNRLEERSWPDKEGVWLEGFCLGE
jgi:hypothetical protein